MRTFCHMLVALCICFAVSGTSSTAEEKYPLVFEEDFEKGAKRWQPTDPKAWRVVEVPKKGNVYNQHKKRSKYNPPHRSPYNMALVKDLVLSDFVLEADLQSTIKDYGHRDMCLFFGYQDPAHFYYVHLGKKADAHANQIFIVNGAARKKISLSTTNGTNWDDEWHRVKIVRNVGNGMIEIYFDNMKKPVMTAKDKHFLYGRIGVGSFDDTGNWDNIKVWGVHAKKSN